METETMQYYILENRGILARGRNFRFEIYDFIKRVWVEDSEHIVSDALMGYDPSEPEGSPYGIGNTSIMAEVKSVSREDAMCLIGKQEVRNLIETWKRELPEKKKEWDKKPGWPAKHVTTEFNLHGNRFVILPEDLIERPDSYDEGFIESVQKDLEKDLKAIGACEITHTGNLD